MRRALMVAYYFPPLGGIGSLRAAKFARYLPDFQWAPTVVAPRNGAYYRDTTLDFGTAEVIRTGSLELSRWGKRLARSGADDTTPATVTGVNAVLRRLARALLYFPDAQVGWYPFAVDAARRALREARFDVVFSTSFPITAHLVARKVSEEAGVPWVAEFRDPWSERVDSRSPHARRANRLERRLLNSAAAVVLPSAAWAQLFATKGCRRPTVVTNGFDPPDVAPQSEPTSFVVSHLGTLYPSKQELTPIWSVLAGLRTAGVLPELTLRFIGDLAPSVRACLGRHGLDDVVDVTGFVPYRESLKRLTNSSLLILAGPTHASPIDRGQIAAKVFEYLATSLPILYVGDATLDVANLLARQPGCHVLAPEDQAGIRAAVIKSVPPARYKRDLDLYTRENLTRRLATLFEQVAP